MYETIYRHEMEIQRHHRSSATHRRLFNAVNELTPKANNSDYRGRMSRQIWKPLHAMIVFTGLRK
ncbi:hypothetical protein ACTHPH_18850 [Paenibacillus pasadenensis]|uniref:Uncharacterized protein n=1 Tax=Paenibacillus pasadenensis TaxID=217090 RepID=A0A2N5N6B3_9BACL|nr:MULTISPECIES: hypothetical protein [Paenibacillus]PLT45896.1 hypothetical protein B8V81_4327 [Paenibacillus pasadenensis]QGG56315.1 hypothetical protein GE073_12485 [Paenibacillus sp. B01]